MTAFTITAVNTVSQTLSSNELGLISATGALLPVSGTAVTIAGSASLLINQGTIISNLYAVFVNSGVSGVTISNSGELYGRTVGIFVNTGVAAANANITNSGVIRGVSGDSDGIYITTGGNRIVNSGEITTFGDNAIQINANFAGGDPDQPHPEHGHDDGFIRWCRDRHGSRHGLPHQLRRLVRGFNAWVGR